MNEVIYSAHRENILAQKMMTSKQLAISNYLENFKFEKDNLEIYMKEENVNTVIVPNQQQFIKTRSQLNNYAKAPNSINNQPKQTETN